jgi:hypothetical protein
MVRSPDMNVPLKEYLEFFREVAFCPGRPRAMYLVATNVSLYLAGSIQAVRMRSSFGNLPRM